MKIKILTVTTSGLNVNGGITMILLDYYSRFDKSDFDLHLIASGTYESEIVKRFTDAGVSIHYLPSRKQHTLKYIISLWRLMRREKYDMIYVHGSSAIMSIELLVAFLAGCKIRVVHSHNTSCDHLKADKILRPLFNCLYTDALACGQEAGKWLFGKLPFKIVNNGRDTDLYRFDPDKRAAMRKALGAEEASLFIGHVGTFNWQKNQMFLVHVFSELVRMRPNARLYFMGGGKDQSRVRQLAEELNVADQVVFTGAVTNVPDMLQAMDVMAFPSLHEGLPLVVVEWQIAALPSLISDAVTKECVFTDFVHFKSLDSGFGAWAQALVNMSDFDRKTRAEDAKQLAIKNGFDINQNAVALQDYFKKRLNRE